MNWTDFALDLGFSTLFTVLRAKDPKILQKIKPALLKIIKYIKQAYPNDPDFGGL